MHPSIKIICLLVLAIAVHALGYKPLLAMAAALLGALLYYRASGFLRILKRLRWLLLSLLLIFAFNTPGEYMQPWPFDFAPTYEGLQAGLLQAVRLSMMLAGLSLLLVKTNREQLMAGFFLLLYPLRYMNLSPERFAARLWLTLHYVEQSEGTKTKAGFFDRLDELKSHDDEPHNGPETIELVLPAMSWRDIVVVIVLIVAGIYLL